jgi:DNA-binding transcriptional LysR family regulator
MDVKHLRCFIAVAEELHFGKAAERLGLAPPALSRIIKALEDELGVPLLQRTTRQVMLTRAGLSLLDESRQIISRLEGATRTVRDAAASTSRTLRIGAIDAASASFLPDALVRFRDENAKIAVHFVEAMTAPLMQMLETGRLDMCLTRPPRKLGDSTFEVLRVERPLVLLPAAHPLAHASTITMRDLVSEPFVIPSKRGRPYAHDLVMTYFEQAGTVPNVVIEATEKPAVLSCVAAGLGLALAPDWVSRLTYPGVVMRRLSGALFDPPPAGALVGVAWRPHQKLTARDAFLSILRDTVTLMDDKQVVPFALPFPAQASPAPRLQRRGR